MGRFPTMTIGYSNEGQPDTGVIAPSAPVLEPKRKQATIQPDKRQGLPGFWDSDVNPHQVDALGKPYLGLTLDQSGPSRQAMKVTLPAFVVHGKPAVVPTCYGCGCSRGDLCQPRIFDALDNNILSIRKFVGHHKGDVYFREAMLDLLRTVYQSARNKRVV